MLLSCWGSQAQHPSSDHSSIKILPQKSCRASTQPRSNKWPQGPGGARTLGGSRLPAPASEGWSVSADGTRGWHRDFTWATPRSLRLGLLLAKVYMKNSHNSLSRFRWNVSFSAHSTPALCTNRRAKRPVARFWLSASTEFGWGWAPGGSAGATFTPQAAKWPGRHPCQTLPHCWNKSKSLLRAHLCGWIRLTKTLYT